ncbi:hypothetical protein K438DRAFT_1969060 [Mycena galopus ATCC 62051]|nr:hypothetical protein K438DRAFT_1978912 [Mycena galopus ATCC 62051]KAF8194445.1 hypothetical protein K438DRAFT_1969060 [Mycena galopus ATCC 62051]
MSADRCEPAFYPDPGEPALPPPHTKVYLVCGGSVRKPGGVSADSQYKFVPGATIKRFENWELLRNAWHARCDAGAHAHPARGTHSPNVQPASPRIPPAQQPPSSSAPDSPPIRTYIIDSRSPSPTPVSGARACALVPRAPVPRAPVPRASRPRVSAPPPYAPLSPSSNAGSTRAAVDDMCYAVRIGRQGEIFTSGAEARARFNALRAAGTPGGFVISPSVDHCISWIRNTPSEAEIAEARIIRYAEEEDDDEVPEDSDSFG